MRAVGFVVVRGMILWPTRGRGPGTHLESPKSQVYLAAAADGGEGGEGTAYQGMLRRLAKRDSEGLIAGFSLVAGNSKEGLKK